MDYIKNYPAEKIESKVLGKLNKILKGMPNITFEAVQCVSLEAAILFR